MAEIVDSTVENREKPVESQIREDTMGQKGEVIRAERIMEPILSVDIFTHLIVGVFDKAVRVSMVPQSKDKKES